MTGGCASNRCNQTGINEYEDHPFTACSQSGPALLFGGIAVTLTAFTLVTSAVLLIAIARLALKISVRERGRIEASSGSVVPAAGQLPNEPWIWLGLSCYTPVSLYEFWPCPALKRQLPVPCSQSVTS